MSLRTAEVKLRAQTQHVLIRLRSRLNQRRVNQFQSLQVAHLFEEDGASVAYAEAKEVKQGIE